MNALKGLLAFVLIWLSTAALAQQCTYQNNTLNIPALQVGTAVYSATLNVVNPNPLTLQLTGAQLLAPKQTTNVYDIRTGKVSLPQVNVVGAGIYTGVELTLQAGSDPLRFVVTAASPPSASLALFAGTLDGWGNVDGTGGAARFYSPMGVATDSAGNVYVADAGNSTIRKITPGGVVTTLAGTANAEGFADGAGAAARFYFPTDVATDSAGNVYVADPPIHLIRKITPGGMVTTFAGTGSPGSADGTGAAVRLHGPEGVATDSAGNVYVADTQNHTIRKITPSGTVTTLAGTAGFIGSADGTGAAARFNYPRGVATDSAGNVYVADRVNSTIRKITPAGAVTTLAGKAGVQGSSNGTGAAARFSFPQDVATDSAGNVYVADGPYTIRKITPAGVVTTFAGTAGAPGSTDGIGASASFTGLEGIATDGAGNVYVADGFNNTIRKITAAGEVTTLAGKARVVGSADGTGAEARFGIGGGVGTDSAGNVYVADNENETLRKITPEGVVTTLAGRAGVRGSSDGIGAEARFDSPYGGATDSAGNVYVADAGNHTIRKITPAGVVTTFAGTEGARGSADGTGAAARFNIPTAVATDIAGNLYVADSDRTTIRKIAPGGVVTTFAGTAGAHGSADGTGAAATFTGLEGIATDGAGNVYVADGFNNTIRKITAAGEVTTLAGKARVVGSADGTGADARFNYPSGVATDSAGNVYVVDSRNYTIRKITPAGVVSTIVGVAGRSSFVPGPLPGLIGYGRGLSISGTSLYISFDGGVAVVRNVP